MHPGWLGPGARLAPPLVGVRRLLLLVGPPLVGRLLPAVVALAGRDVLGVLVRVVIVLH